MKAQADKNRTECVFQVGDKVYLKMQPYVQTSMGRRTNQKLSFKYFGPYEILQKVGSVAYKLQLPDGSLIHPVVHVSLLKPAIPTKAIAQPDLPLQCTEMETGTYPLAITDHKWIQEGKSSRHLVQVQWSGMPSSWLTWENQA